MIRGTKIGSCLLGHMNDGRKAHIIYMVKTLQKSSTGQFLL